MQSDGNVKQIAVGYWIYPHIAEGYILPRIRERLPKPHDADTRRSGGSPSGQVGRSSGEVILLGVLPHGTVG